MLKTIAKEILRFSAFALILISITAIAANQKSDGGSFVNNDILTADNLNTMQVEWTNILNKPATTTTTSTGTLDCIGIGSTPNSTFATCPIGYILVYCSGTGTIGADGARCSTTTSRTGNINVGTCCKIN